MRLLAKSVAVLLVCSPAVWLRAQAPQPQRNGPFASVRLSGLLDGYYSLNFNHPSSRVNQLRNFDADSGQITLNMARLSAELEPAPVGFRVDVGFGKAFDMIHAGEADPNGLRFIQQAYVSLMPRNSEGLRLDFGKFVTAAGAEVIESHLNWNYSRSLLFAYAIPYYHFGLRLKAPLGAHLSTGVELVNGWNNVRDNNSGKTVGLSAALSGRGFGWTHVYYVGPEKAGTNEGRRQVYDTTLTGPLGRLGNFYVNFDYGREAGGRGEANQHWVGVGGAARLALHPRFALAPRLEWFRDADGFATGSAQRLKETTLTAEFKLTQGVWTRLEYRRDWSDQPFFDRGADVGVARSQQTLLAGLIFCFACEP
jgi:hypothetical protein